MEKMKENKASKKIPEKVNEKKRSWVKAHLYCCCKTNAFVAVKVTKSNVSDKDVKVVRELMKRPTKLFDMTEFVADKAYAVRPIYNILAEMHMKPYIPFMRKSKGAPKGVQLWRTCYDEFHNNTEEFMKKYHRRSNI